MSGKGRHEASFGFGLACVLVLGGVALTTAFAVGKVGVVAGAVGGAAVPLGLVVMVLTYLVHRPRPRSHYLVAVGAGLVTTAVAALLFQPILSRIAVVVLRNQEVLDPNTTVSLMEIAELLSAPVPSWTIWTCLGIGVLIVLAGAHASRDPEINVTINSVEAIEGEVRVRPSEYLSKQDGSEQDGSEQDGSEQDEPEQKRLPRR